MQLHALNVRLASISRTLMFFGLILVVSVAPRANAVEIIAKNDTVFGPGYPATPNPLPNTSWADLRLGTRLTSPVDGKIVGIQVAWGSIDGTAAPSTEGPIRISTAVPSGASGSGFLSLIPGVTLATIESPVLVDGLVNEFRYLDPATGLLPIDVPVTAGQNFFVDLQHVSFTPGPFPPASLPGVLMDQNFQDFDRDGFLYPLGNRWVITALGVLDSGNFGIRAIIQPVPEPSTYALAACGILGLAVFRRRRAACC